MDFEVFSHESSVWSDSMARSDRDQATFF
jgi:hypothetical protein